MDEGNQVFPQGESAALLVIEFPSFRDFIDAYSPIISEEGIFIRNADVSESNAFTVGDRVDFEVRLKDDFRLIQGAGEVVWLGPSEAAEGAPGTAIKFHDVDEPSKRLISRLVDNYVRDGGKLFEIGPEAVAEDAKPEPEPEPEAEPGLEPKLESEPATEAEALGALSATGDHAALTAEHLEAREADELFAGEDDEPVPTVEFESVSLEDVEQGKSEADASVPDLEQPVGLDTIAIPSGLVASLASEGADAALEHADESESEAPVESPVESEAEPLEAAPGPVEESLDPGEPAPAAGAAGAVSGFPEGEAAVADGANDPEASFSEVSDPVGSLEPPLDEDFDQGSLEAAAVSLDGELGGGGGIPDDIAQVAEELSGVHRFELPDEPDEASGVDYAGSASVGSERNTGGWIAALAVAFVLLGAGAFYFGGTILGYLGWGSDEIASESSRSERAGESTSADRSLGAPVGAEGTAAEPDSETTDQEEPDGDPAAGVDAGEAGSTASGTEQEAPEFEPVQVTVERDLDTPATGDGTGTGATPAAEGPAEPASAPVVAAASRRVERITWREEGDDTVVAIRLNAEISGALVEVVRVRDGAPREVIKIQGVEVPYSPSEVAVGNRHLQRLRTGLHRDASGSSLHVVADLTAAGVTVLSVEPKGRDLLITFS